ncbi:MAG: hypothetical protein IID36_10980, partial [Planctomycetes bacterium]|nr:hypothetical protein [Planctomycetota bacterium]
MATANATGLVELGTVTIDGAFLGDGDWADRDVDFFSFQISPPTLPPVFLTVEIVSDDENLDAFLRLF